MINRLAHLDTVFGVHSFPNICVNIRVKDGENAGKYNNLEDRTPVSYKSHSPKQCFRKEGNSKSNRAEERPVLSAQHKTRHRKR